MEILTDYIYIITAIGGWFTAQGIKIILSMKQDKVDFMDWLTSGGMPSSHVSLVTSLALVIGLVEGFTSPLFGIALTMWGIVTYDAMGVRRATGENTKNIHMIVEKLQLRQQKQAYYLALGHSPLQVFGGTINGIIWAGLVFWALG